MASVNTSDELNHEKFKEDDKHEVVNGTDGDGHEVVRGTDGDRQEVVRGTDGDRQEVVRGTDVDKHEIVRGTHVAKQEVERGTNVDKQEVVRGTHVDKQEDVRGTNVEKHQVVRETNVDKHKVVRGTAVSLSQENKPVCYQPCTKHSKSKYHLDHFCEYHTCLVCYKCARKVHAKCSVVPVKDISREITLLDIEDFGRAVIRKKAALLSAKEKIDSKLLDHLEDQRKAVLNEFEDMLKKQEEKLKSLKMKFQEEVEELFNKQSKIILDQMVKIDKIVANLDAFYRDIQTIETEYKHENEKHFIRFQETVDEINHNLEGFRRLENSCETVSMEFHANEGLNKFIKKVNSLGTLKVRIKSWDSGSCVDDVVFPPIPRGKETDKTEKSKYGTKRSCV